MTIGMCTADEAVKQLAELPRSNALKLKVGDPLSVERVARIVGLDDRRCCWMGIRASRPCWMRPIWRGAWALTV